VVAVSAYQKEAYDAAHPSTGEPARLVYNGVPAPTAVEAGAEVPGVEVPGVESPGPVVLAAGLLRPDRGHTHLVRAARMMRSRPTVLIAGDGPLRAQLAAQVAAQPADVRLLGFRADVPALLGRADVLAHPSLTDALPTAVLHALAHGVPVVASRVGGIPEIVTDEVGVLVPPADPPALAAALDALLADPDRRAALGEAGRLRFSAQFSAEAWADRLREVYDQLLGNRSAHLLRQPVETGMTEGKGGTKGT
jgi:glycosyltransferase involved in cell wall biosynthesis